MMAMDEIKKPPFPWTFLSEPEGPEAELAAVWIFLQLQGRAYKDFLDTGPGILVGPFFSDEDDVAMTTREAVRRHAGNGMVGISVMYLPVRSAQFGEMVPVESVRETIYLALEGYNPESQCVVLLRHDDTAISVSVIGVEEATNGPRAAYYRELLDRSVPDGLPN
jgi:hypothetical protein